MKYGFSLVVRGNDATPEAFLAMAQRAEALELDALWCSAHIIVPPQVKSDYAMVPGRKHGEHWKECYWEPFTLLSYLAGLTRRITLGTSIIVLPMHNPYEVAKQVAEVDQLSGGRFILGVGVGWFEEEFEVLGQDFHTRGRRMDEQIRLLRMLWAEPLVTFEGEWDRVTQAGLNPLPPRRDIPIWMGGSDRRAIDRAGRSGTSSADSPLIWTCWPSVAIPALPSAIRSRYRRTTTSNSRHTQIGPSPSPIWGMLRAWGPLRTARQRKPSRRLSCAGH